MNTIYQIVLIDVLWKEYQNITKFITKLKWYHMQLNVEQDMVPMQ